MSKHDGGKGDTPIPPQNKDQFDRNWDAIFNKSKENDDQKTKDSGV
jgi:hypothetical protein